MVRILSGSTERGRGGFSGFLDRRFRRGVRRLSKSDPTDGVLNADISSIPLLSVGTKASLATNLTGTDNDLLFTAKEEGTEGNSIRVRYVDPGAATQALAVSVSGQDISVSLATNGSSVITSTATLVMNAINAHAGASALVTAELKASNSGAGVVTAFAYTALTGGAEGLERAPLPPELALPVSSPTIMGRDQWPDAPISVTGKKVGTQATNRRLRKR